MNIKSLLLGSAVASVAFTGAQAADAIFVPEPEPVEYVRVCDVYGAGFFYIPGTETCLRIGAEIRYQVGTSGENDLVGDANYNSFVPETWNSHSRARIFLDARSETEYGLLRGYVRYDARRTRGTDDSNLNHAWLSLGGFRA